MRMLTKKSATKRKLGQININDNAVHFSVVCFATREDLRRAIDKYQGFCHDYENYIYLKGRISMVAALN